MANADEIALEPPLSRNAGVTPAVEDRSYLGFIAAALAAALGGGFLMAVWMPLAATGAVGGQDRVPWLIQAHGWVQVQGWAGLFVAGMAVRLMPRFAGRPPVGRNVTLPLLAALGLPVALRMTLQPWATGTLAEATAAAIGVLSAVGAAGVAAILAWTLGKGRKARDPWRYFAWAGTAWWAVLAAMLLTWGVRAARNEGLAPVAWDDVMTWVVLLGPIGNFIWSVQSRSVPIFFGRKTPTWRQAVVPGVAYNAGAALVALSLLFEGETAARLSGSGMALAGAGMVWLPVIAGSVWGQAKRLRPRAKPAARFVLGANIAAVVAGVLLVWAGAQTALDAEYAEFAARDAARHVVGIGLVTMLILGMARLVAPVFALERTESGVPKLYERAPFWLLLGALVLRGGSALLAEQISYDARMHSAATAGALAWLAIAIFAVSVLRAVRAEPATRRALETLARK
ncbi:MAG: hypothetical protein M9925_09315 [Chloroflexi bacterium]|nr:hypothetical protein [Chloroflexota bacterium]